MASRSNLGGPGGVEIVVDGNTTPLVNKIEEAKAKVEAANATLAAGADSGKAAAEVAAVGTAAQGTTQALEQMGQAGDQAIGPNAPVNTGLKDFNKTVNDSVGQVYALLGRLTAVAGTAVGMFELGQAIRKYVVEALEDGSEKAKDFTAGLNFNDSAKSAAALREEIQKVEGELAATRESYDAVREAGFGATAELLRGPAIQAKQEEQLAELRRKLRIEERDVAANEERDARTASFAEYADDLVKRNLAEIEARRSAIEVADKLEDERSRKEDARRKERIRAIGDEMKAQEDLADRVAEYQRRQREAAERTKQAWVDSLTAIKAASNDVFGNNRAVSDAGMAGVVSSIGTRSGANNRVVFEGGN
jgi:hypothetical protein